MGLDFDLEDEREEELWVNRKQIKRIRCDRDGRTHRLQSKLESNL